MGGVEFVSLCFGFILVLFGFVDVNCGFCFVILFEFVLLLSVVFCGVVVWCCCFLGWVLDCFMVLFMVFVTCLCLGFGF